MHNKSYRISDLALRNLLKRHPGAVKNGLKKAIREITSRNGGDDISYKEVWSPRFIPDATLLQGDSLTIFEIEDTSLITDEKMEAMQLFCHELYDEYGVTTKIITTCRYGVKETLIYDVEDEIVWNQKLVDGEWIDCIETSSGRDVSEEFAKLKTK